MQETGNEDVLDEEQKDEQGDAVAQRPRYPSEQIVVTARLGHARDRAVDLGWVGHIPMLAGANGPRGEPRDPAQSRPNLPEGE